MFQVLIRIFIYGRGVEIMREIIQQLNKATLASATGISHSRLRKYANGIVKQLTREECEKIRAYLLALAEAFK